MTDKQPSHVEQALAELESGNDEQKKAAQKRLDAAGFARAAKARAAVTEDGDKGEDKASRAPQGRRAPGKQQA